MDAVPTCTGMAEFPRRRGRSFDRNATTGHNCCMLRRVLLAAVLCLAVLATADRVSCSLDSIGTAASTVSCTLDAPGSTDRPDHRWDAGSRTSASITESIWRSQLHHAELAGALCLDGCDAIRRSDTPRRRTLPAPRHLHDIPLLI